MSWLRVGWYYFCLHLARFLFFLMGGITSRGKHNVPRKGAVIVAPLHVSTLDPPAVACGTNRRLRFMAKEELFRYPFFGWLIRSLGAFPVKRGEGDTESIRLAMEYLKQGEAVLIFPEGTRGDGEAMLPINRGVAMLAKRTGAAVLPVGVIGTHVVMPKGAKRLRRRRMIMAYGEPFTYEQIAVHESEKLNRDAFAAELERRILTLCRENGMPLRSASETERSAVFLPPETGGDPQAPTRADTQSRP
jgi:1-acyl-sn-glycerol-3-phosphate acyltransferase